jgi:hypothetical protein
MRQSENALEDVGDETTQTAGRLKLLERSVDSSTFSFAKLTASTSGLSFSFGGLTTSLTTATVAMGAMTAASTALLSTLVPLAAVVGTVAAGLGAVAAAFGAVIGTGILAFGAKRGDQNRRQLKQIRQKIETLEAQQETEEGLTETQQDRLETLREQADQLEEQTGITGGLQDAISELREEIAPLLVEFGETFIPLIKDAVEALPALVENTLKAIGGLDRFRAVLRDLGQQAFRVIPDLVAAIFRLAEIALPPLLDALDFLARNADDVFSGMLRITRELAPELRNLVAALVDILPQLAGLGTAILDTAIPAVTRFITVLDELLEDLESADNFVEFLQQTISDAAAWLVGPGRRKLGELVTDFIDTLEDQLTVANVADAADAAIDAIGDIITDIQQWFTKGGKQKLVNIATDFMGGIATALDNNQKSIQKDILKPALDILVSVVRAMAAALTSDEANAVLRELVELATRTLRTLAKEMVKYAQSDQFKQDLQGLGVAVTDAMQAVIAGAIAGGAPNPVDPGDGPTPLPPIVPPNPALPVAPITPVSQRTSETTGEIGGVAALVRAQRQTITAIEQLGNELDVDVEIRQRDRERFQQI